MGAQELTDEGLLDQALRYVSRSETESRAYFSLRSLRAFDLYAATSSSPNHVTYRNLLSPRSRKFPRP